MKNHDISIFHEREMKLIAIIPCSITLVFLAILRGENVMAN